MLCASRSRWVYLSLVIISSIVVAEPQSTAANECNWYCWVEESIAALTKQVNKLTELLGAAGHDDVQDSSSSPRPASTSAWYTSTFGTPYTIQASPSDQAADFSTFFVSTIISETTSREQPTSSITITVSKLTSETLPNEQLTSPTAVTELAMTTEASSAEQLANPTTVTTSSMTPEALSAEESDVATTDVLSTTTSEVLPTEQAVNPSTVSVSTMTSEVSSESTAVPSPQIDVNNGNGYRAVGYFGNWDVYARKYFPQQVPASKLTHLLYAFADNTADGTVTLSDSYADVEMHYPGDSWNDPGNNVYGAIKQLGLLKQKNRNLKVLLSIGGWTYTNTKKDLDPVGASEAARKNFAASCVDMIKNYGFDGIDVDWEYPQSIEQGNQFLTLLREIRQAMDDYADHLAKEKGYAGEARPHFLLSIAAPAGADNYNKIPLREVAETLDFVNLMAYDFAGSWSNLTGHASNLSPSKSNPDSTPFNANSVIKEYIAAGVPSIKLNLGMPLYGRAFTNTAGLGQPYKGVGQGTWEAGVYDFKDLPLAGAHEYTDEEAEATYSYDNSTGMLVSYDTVKMALTKVDYITQNNLGGAMWWEVSGDRNDSGSIISSVVNKLLGADGKGIESRSNWVYYPDSEYDNVKDGFTG